jgi:hypothetical protein
MTDDKPGEGKGILDQLIEEAFKKGKISATQDDFAVNLRTTDKDGEHVIEGIPVSQAQRWLYEKFGIGEPPAGEGGGKEGEGKEGEGKEGEGKEGAAGKPTLKSYFGGKQAASG